MSTYTNEQVAHLVEGSLDWETTFRMLSMPKDNSRFEQYLAALQAKVSFPERIVLPLGPHLYIVQDAKTKQWVTQCDCGHVFGDYRENWKLKCRIRTRKTLAAMAQVFDPAPAVPEPGFQEVREFFCPACATQHAVEVVAPGYPVVMELLPDLDKFYRDYLGQPLPDQAADWYEDRSADVTARWV